MSNMLPNSVSTFSGLGENKGLPVPAAQPPTDVVQLFELVFATAMVRYRPRKPRFQVR